MKVLHRLWVEDGGFVISTEAIVILTMIICATVVGWQAVREAVVSELADIGAAIAAIDQSYSYAGFEGHSAACPLKEYDGGGLSVGVGAVAGLDHGLRRLARLGVDDPVDRGERLPDGA